jgi:hypothetical protein
MSEQEGVREGAAHTMGRNVHSQPPSFARSSPPSLPPPPIFDAPSSWRPFRWRRPTRARTAASETTA